MSSEQPQIDLEIQIDEALAAILPEGTEDLLHQAVTTTLQNSGNSSVSAPTPYSLTILLTTDEQLRQLNRDYLDIDQPTDVLSFPDGNPLPDGGVYLGDIAISVERAQQQAAAGGHALNDELQLLAVHGVLHLLGHDHAEEAEKRTMWATQAAILAELGLHKITINTDEEKVSEHQ